MRGKIPGCILTSSELFWDEKGLNQGQKLVYAKYSLPPFTYKHMLYVRLLQQFCSLKNISILHNLCKKQALALLLLQVRIES
jgi:hypothetical protein